MRAHLLFEQSGAFKNAFIKNGVPALDYDISNTWGQTDVVCDLFKEIERGYQNEPCVFDDIKKEDVTMAFFPCTRFEVQIPLLFRGEGYQQKKWSDVQKLEYGMGMHKELHELYEKISQLSVIFMNRGLKLIIENPYAADHYLTKYWSLKPCVIDYDRREDGDYFKKPTQYWFVNCEPKTNLIFEAIEWVETRKICQVRGKDKTTAKEERSLMHPQYADRFIRRYVLKSTKE